MKHPKTGGDLYPRPVMLFDYFIADSVKTPIRLEIENAAGETLNTFISDKWDVVVDWGDTCEYSGSSSWSNSARKYERVKSCHGVWSDE
mgnify:CR=1 FL=1